MSKRFTDSNKYKKSFFRGLPGAYKLFWDYLYHDCDHAGIWHVDFEIAQIYLGSDMRIEKEEALRLFNTGEERIRILNGGSKWLIVPFVHFQYGDLNPQNRAHSSVISLLAKEGIKGLESSIQGAKYMDKDKVKDKDKGKFVKPTLKEVSDFCLERGNEIDPQDFLDKNDAKGWKVGKTHTPMKDWKATIRTWEKNNYGSQNGGSGGSGESARDKRVREAREERKRILGTSGASPGVPAHVHQGRDAANGSGGVGSAVIESSCVEIKASG